MSETVPRPSHRTHMPPVRVKVAFWVLVLAPRSMVIPPLARTEGTLKANALGGPRCGCPSRLKRMRSIALASVAVPTVERASARIGCWSTVIAVVSPSSTSTSGRASVGMKPCTKALYGSLISRCDSAAIVPNTSELLPDPETPVNTVSRRFGSSTLTSLRLFTRAPRTRIMSWRSAGCVGADCWSVVVAVLIGSPSVGGRPGPAGSGELVDAHHVARRVAEGAVADAVRLLDGFLHDLGSPGLQLLEGAVEGLGGEHDDPVGALRHHLGDGPLLLVGDARIGRWRVQHDRGAGLPGGADGDPAHAAVPDVVADLEAERVAVEGQRGLRVVVGEEGRVDGDVHGDHATDGSATGASRFLTGLVTCLATQAGMPAVPRAASRR